MAKFIIEDLTTGQPLRGANNRVRRFPDVVSAQSHWRPGWIVRMYFRRRPW